MLDVKLDSYQGPLDLLLKLIDKDKIDIYDIPINQITNEYLEIVYNNTIKAEDLSEFLILASTLIEIKSKMLLPNDKIEEEDPRDKLVERLIEYKNIKLLQDLLNENMKSAKLSHHRLHEEIVPNVIEINIEENVNKLLDVFNDILKSKKFEDEKDFEKVILEKDEFMLSEYIDMVLKKLKLNRRIAAEKIIEKLTVKMQVIMTFIAILELVKAHKILVNQINDKGLIIELREDDDGDR